jgi:hypothetical protein
MEMAATVKTTKTAPATRLTKPKNKGSASVRLERKSQIAALDRELATKMESKRAVVSITPPTPTGEVAVLTTDPKILANLKPYQPTPTTIAEAMVPKIEKPNPESKVKRGAPINTRYEGSQTQRWDTALREGGTYQEIGEKVGKPASLMRGHAKFREKGGKWKLVDLGNDRVQMVAVTPASK